MATKIRKEQLNDYDGWIPSNETWTYASADDPTFTFTISGDKTGKYSPGMRIKLTQTTVKYFIITAVSYSAPNTTVTVYGGTDYDLANATITSPYYSGIKAPFGFPLNPAKWTVEATDTSLRSQASPVAGTWYNLGSVNISVPIGIWKLSYKVLVQYVMTASNEEIYCTLSTANNSESDSVLSSCIVGNGINISQQFNNVKESEVVASKTTYYLNSKHTQATAGNTIYNRGDNTKTIIRAVCAYL